MVGGRGGCSGRRWHLPQLVRLRVGVESGDRLQADRVQEAPAALVALMDVGHQARDNQAGNWFNQLTTVVNYLTGANWPRSATICNWWIVIPVLTG